MHMKITRLTVALWFCLGCAAQPQAAATTSVPIVAAAQAKVTPPEQSGFDAARLARIDSVMQRGVSDGSLPGALTLVARRGQIVHFGTHGFSDREQSVPMAKDALFRIFSMTKPITSVALMTLYEEGRFELDDRLGDYLPELAKLQVAVDPEKHGKKIATRPPTRDVTIRDLLRHTSGFSYGYMGDTAVDRSYREAGLLSPKKSAAELVQTLGALPLQYDPGTRFHYSVSTDVAGRLVEVLSGQSLSTFFEQRIFKPLAMSDTSFQVASDKLGRLAKIYVESDKGDLQLAPASETDRYTTNPENRFESGGGGLVSSASDYLRFCEMLRRGGELDGVRLLAPKTVELMTQNHVGTVINQPGMGFGLGFGVTVDAGLQGTPMSNGSYWWGGAAGTAFLIDPKEELVLLYMVQIRPKPGPMALRSPRYKHADRFRTLVYQALADERTSGKH
jgi:CubicO group peptidase (beta-lactamase class C family)